MKKPLMKIIRWKVCTNLKAILKEIMDVMVLIISREALIVNNILALAKIGSTMKLVNGVISGSGKI